jgi:hypothetical protein
MLVFVSSPYAGDIERNVDAARNYCRFVAKAGHTPVAPHLLFPQFLDDDDPEERKAGLQMGLELLDLCSELWSFGEPSAGMKEELRYATEKFIPIRLFPAMTEETIPGLPERKDTV